MSDITTVGLDLAKNVFQVHASDGSGHALVRKKLRRAQVLEFFSKLRPCVVAMEACGGAHFWGREIGKLGHDVRLIRRLTSSRSSSVRKTMLLTRKRSATQRSARRCGSWP